MPRDAKMVLVIIITITALIGFAASVGYSLYQTWIATDAAPSFTDAYLYVATGLIGLVGGIVAAGFGQSTASGEKPPETNLKPQPGRMARSVTAVGSLVVPGHAKQSVGIAYAAVYFAMGVAAVVTWVLKSSVAPDLVKNLAMIVIGLIVAIVGTFMGES